VASPLQDERAMAQRLALLALLLAPTLAAAQANPAAGVISIVESTDSSQSSPIVNIAECKGDVTDILTYHWNVANFAGGGTYDIWLADRISTSTDCPAVTSSTVTVNSTSIATGLAATAAQQRHVDGSAVQARLSAIGVDCIKSVTEVYLCVNYNPPSGNRVVNAASGRIRIDLGVPPTPASVSVGPGDTVLHVSWAEGTGGTGTTGATDGYRVFWGPRGGDLTLTHDLTGAGTRSYDIGRLQNGTEYDVQVAALTEGKNPSTPSDRVLGIPVFVNDFWRLYREDGGREQGGCAAGAGGVLTLLALVPLALRRRRRRP
jgi:Synergist-CTERM protein sorting domain-containing protein